MSNTLRLTTSDTKSQLLVYREEIFNFLKSVTIKFTPFAHQMGEPYLKNNPALTYLDIHSSWNPYYRNLFGEYTELDTMMHIYSLETENNVEFTKENLLKYPKSAALFRIPNQEYLTLIDRYPSQEGLIKHIVYPVKSIQEAIDAPELSLLAFDDKLLFEGERESLISYLKDFLTMVRERWWVEEYCYEDLYATAFYYLLWDSLPNVLLSQRIDNIKTPFVHPFHIWEYLISHGLGDYRDILSINQARWLYRNLPWILRNKGKEITLQELAKHILAEYRVNLGGITIHQETLDATENCSTTPLLITTHIETGEELDRLTTDQLLSKIETAKLISYTPIDKRVEIEKELANTNQNLLKTKYLEFVQQPVDTQYQEFLSEFLYDSLMYRYTTNDLSYKIKVKDGGRGVYYNLYPDEAIVLLYYSLHAQLDDHAVNLPKQVTLRIPFVKDKPEYTDVRESFKLLGTTYLTSNRVDIDKEIDKVPFHPQVFRDHDEFISFIGEQFKVLFDTVRWTNTSCDAIYHESMGYVYDTLLFRQTVPVKFDHGVTTLTEYRAKHNEVDEILSYYDKSRRKEDYEQLSKSILMSLFPLTHDSFKQVGIAQYDEKIYQGLKKLFSQLSSYNITFLDTPRLQYKSVPLGMILTHMEYMINTGRIWLVPIDGVQVAGITTWINGFSKIPLGITMNSFDVTSVKQPNTLIELGPSIEMSTKSIYKQVPVIGTHLTIELKR